MSKYKSMPCSKCAAPIPDRPDRRGTLCLACQRSNRCADCGQILGLKEHRCANVDKLPPRNCIDCGRELDKGNRYERQHKWCAPCGWIKSKESERRARADARSKFGDACQACGYDKCSRALHFHHVDGSKKKEFRASGTSVREIRGHPERFMLLCANCHIEEHERIDRASR